MDSPRNPFINGLRLWGSDKPALAVSKRANRSDEGLALETSGFFNGIDPVDKTKFLCFTSPPTQHYSFFRN